MLALCTLCVLWLNHLVLLTIEKLVYGGDGLARLPADEHGRGKAVFVPFVLPGEQVEASLLEQKPGFLRPAALSPAAPTLSAAGDATISIPGMSGNWRSKPASSRKTCGVSPSWS